MSTANRPSDKAAESATIMDRFEETAFKWGGLIMIFLAVAFAMGIAIDHGLFTPPLRVAAGILVGTALIGVGVFTYVGRPIFGQSLQGVGIAVIFLSVFAGHQMFDVFSWEGAMGGTIVVTALSFWLAARRGDSALAAIGLLGGVTAPFVLTLGDAGGTGAGSVNAYVIYATTLLLSAIAVYFFNGWGTLLVTASGLSLATFGSVVMQLDAGDSLVLAQVGVTLIGVALWLVPTARVVLERPMQVSRHSIDRVWSDFFRGSELGSVLWAPAATVAASARIWDLSPEAAGLVALAAAILVGVVGAAVRTSERILGLTHFAAAATLVAVASLLLLDGSVLQVALAGQAFAYLVVGSRSESPVLTITGAMVGVPVLAWLGFELVVAFDFRESIEPSQLIAHLFVILFVAVGAVLDQRGQVRATAGAGAYVLAVLWLAEAFLGVRNGPALTTASWILLAAGTAYVGIRTQSKVAVQAAIGTVVVAVAKLLTVDLVQINAVGRTISFFVAGVVLVAFGYRYPAMREIIHANEPDVEPKDRRFMYADPQPRPPQPPKA
ncbi:MAG: DUF2339 domain-containing protein [Acidimicrobiia bacterium]|nr:DUF2339 domain-containing protein [Acidimicrobiia bacterium]